jgi:gliding motility-associated-like protein
MMLKTISIFSVILLLVIQVRSQSSPPVCSTIGQTPATAFPVCGTSVFQQNKVPQCVNNVVPAGNCGYYPDTNPFWYQFTCYKSGTLGFLITPNNLDDDYDWELFDVTGRNPASVYDSGNFVVSYNWSGNSSLESARGYTGKTGATPAGTVDFACATNPPELGGPPPYTDAQTIDKMPQIIQGHTYLLLISHYTQTQSGYQLSFGGGTASINNPNPPALQSASVPCDASTISVKLAKQVQCSSLAADGSDFTISSPIATVISAAGVNCSNGFDLDSLILKLSKPLPPGTYSVTAKIGTDNNTLLDDCENSLPVGSTVSFTIFPQAPTPFDSIAPVGCAPDLLALVFRKPIQCSSIAADGSDFVVTGSTPVTVQAAYAHCDANDQSSIILVKLGAPIQTKGSYQIKLVTGNDGNTIIDECNQQTPAGQSVSFSTADTVSALFSYQVHLGCKYDSIQFSNAGGNGIYQWQWTFDSSFSTLQNPLEVDTIFGTKQAQLIVTNGVCIDTSSETILLDNGFTAAFTAPDNICPTDKVSFQNTSTGNINSWYWDFGDGSSSTDQTPPLHTYPVSNNQEAKYTVQLVAGNNLGCYDTATKVITKVISCYITVPTGFTPNGDGHNDYLYPLNAYKATNLEFRVYNRYGQLVFETRDWTRKWDGTLNGKPQDSGTFVWTLQYTDGDTGKKFFLKGTSVLIR